MAFHEVRFPDNISRGARGGPERRTQIVEMASGDEERNGSWADSRRRYDASYGIRKADDLAAVKPPFPPTILGLYRGPVGRPVVLPTPAGGETPSIVLYRKNLARAVKSRSELSEQIRDTLLHEIGHLEGLDEDDLRRRGME